MTQIITTPHHQFFSVEKANRALVLIRPIVTELLLKHRRLSILQREIEVHEERHQQNPDLDEKEQDVYLNTRYDEVERLLDHITHNIDELSAIGCIFKDFQVGIVDFPIHYQGRDVYLCWQHGEADLTHWHEIEEGYNGRNEITEYFVQHSSGATLPSALG